MLANYAYDLSGSMALFFGCVAVMASLVQMFQIGTMRRQIAELEVRLSAVEGHSDADVVK
jgi:hypothetical protein